MCSVSYSLWLGTEDGEVIILDLISKHSLFRRRLTVRTDQSIVGLYHLVSIRYTNSGVTNEYSGVPLEMS